MTILITGAAGFVGFSISKLFLDHQPDVKLIAIDNLSRRGSEYNVSHLRRLGCQFIHGDVRCKEDIEDLPRVDWIIDCAANPSVLAGLDQGSQALINNNLTGTLYLLEKCRKDNAGFVMLSTSRVYSINELNRIPLKENEKDFSILRDSQCPKGCSVLGISEEFSTNAPVSLYGSTKLASEIMALEYHYSFGFPVWINRCGVIAGPGQFGKIDQGIFSYWIYNYLLDRPLSYIGFGGTGKQVRDFIHPFDVFRLIQKQVAYPLKKVNKIVNIGGGISNSFSLAQLDDFCRKNLKIDKDIRQVVEGRRFDIPLYIADNTLSQELWDWSPSIGAEEILQQIIIYAIENLQLIRSL